jgi:hypothetical protein
VSSSRVLTFYSHAARAAPAHVAKSCALTM